MAKRVTDEEREEIIAEFATGDSCHAIAKKFNRSSNTISRIAKSVGHKFAHVNAGRAREAQRAHRIYGAEWRAETRQRLSEQIWREVESFEKPALVYSFGGKENTFNKEMIDKPGFRDRRDLSQTVSTLWRVVREIDEYETKRVENAQLDTIFAEIDRMADEYETAIVEPEAGLRNQPE